MKEHTDFEKIGKGTPFKVPQGFFEGISEKTLQKAKQREYDRKRRLVFRRVVTGIISVAAVVLLAFLIPSPIHQRESTFFAVEKTLDSQEKLPDTIKPIPSKEVSEKVPALTIPSDNPAEDVRDVLADLSDEELIQLAVRYKSDPFLDEL